MRNWSILGRHAVTTYKGNPHREFIISGKNLIGYAEQSGSEWHYYEFPAMSKGDTSSPEAVLKGKGATIAEAVGGE
jgi:hypothetical protein